MMHASIIFVMLAILIWYLHAKRVSTSPAGAVLVMYLLCFTGGIFVDHQAESYSFVATIYLGATLLLFFIPIIIHAINAKTIEIGKHSKLLSYSWLLVVFGIISLINVVDLLSNIGTYILIPTDYKTQRIYGEIVIERGFISNLSLIGVNLYYLYLILFFIIYIEYPKQRLLRFLLFASSLAYPLTGLVEDMSRGGLVMWCLMVALIYVTFYKYINHDKREFLNRLIVIILTMVLIFFLVITLARGELSGSTMTYFVDYFFHQFGNFNLFYFAAQDQSNDISALFQIFGYEKQSILDEGAFFVSKYGIDTNVFATFIGSAILHLNPVFVFIGAIFFGAFYSILILRSPRGFGTLIVVIAISEVLVWGIFYYNHAWRMSNIIFMFVLISGYYFNPRAGRKVKKLAPISSAHPSIAHSLPRTV
jgi:hypothetical protein